MPQLSVPDMMCDGCAGAITEALTQADSAAQVEVDLQRKQVSVESTLSKRALRKAIKKAGYKSKLV